MPNDVELQDEAARLELLIAAAIVWAKRGVPVFPCKVDKRPCTPNGFYDAATDPGEVRQLFLRYPERCRIIGAPTGTMGGFDALDVDPKNNGHLWKLFEQLPKVTRIHQTVSGGWHYLFKHADGLRSSAGRIAPGIDVRGDGGYVCIPPSPGYAVWLPREQRHDVPEGDWWSLLLDWPDWLLPLARNAHGRFTGDKATWQVGDHLSLTPVPMLECERKLNFALGKVRRAEKGTRHHTLRNMARLIGGYLVWTNWTEEALWDKFADAVSENTDDPNVVEGGTKWKTFMSGLNDGANQPLGLDVAYISDNRPLGDVAPDEPGMEYLPPHWQIPGELVEGLDTSTVSGVLSYFERHYSVVNNRGKIQVWMEQYEEHGNGLAWTRTIKMHFADLERKYSNKTMMVISGQSRKQISLAEFWLDHPKSQNLCPSNIRPASRTLFTS